MDENWQMAQEQAQLNDIKRLAIGNRQLIRVHKDVLFNLIPIPSSDPPNSVSLTNIQQTIARMNIIGFMLIMRQ